MLTEEEKARKTSGGNRRSVPEERREGLSEEQRIQQARDRKRRQQMIARRKRVFRTWACIAAVLLVLLIVLLLVNGKNSKKDKNAGPKAQAEAAADQNADGSETDAAGENGETAEGAGNEQAGENAENAAAPAVQAQAPAFEPYSTDNTKPSNYIEKTETKWNDDSATPREEYNLWYNIDFGLPEDYTDVNGIITFRGNNFRNNPTYGLANMTEFSINKLWTRETGTLEYEGKTWSGSGWTGQPLIVKWPRATKQHMNMYDWAKEDDELVEVIYACLDGRIYFTDLKTGQATRDTMSVGFAFKGAGALDPRGYPIMYVGSGYDSDNGRSRAFIINLLDCSVMYTFGCVDEYSWRGKLSYFDSSALVDADSDTLLYPGENGIIYIMKLNTKYDEAAGTLSIDPGDTIRWRYKGTRSGSEKYWLGIEDSAAIYKGYMFVTDNGGNLMCINLNTLRVVWAQDTLDDSNSTPVLSIEDGHLYLYVGTSFHLGWRSNSTATVPIWKIDAENGEIVWQKDYECYSQSGLSGGVQSTIACGDRGLSDYIYATVSMVGGDYSGVLACINKKTGEVEWEHEAVYAWSSPVCVYNADGTGKVIYATGGGKMYMLNGITGETDSTFVLSEEGSPVEASPAVYEKYLVVGTRDCYIWGFELK